MRSPGTVVLAVALASACCLGTGWTSLAHAGYIDYVSMEFDVYLQQGAIEGNTTVNGAGINGPYGGFVRSISIGNPFAHVTEYPDHIRFETDDCGIGIMDGADISADIYFVEGLPSKVTVIRASGANTQSAMWRYIYDFKIANQVLVHRWQTHYGETIDIFFPSNMITLAPAAPQVNTLAPQGSTASVGLNMSISPMFNHVTLDFGDGETTNLVPPFPTALTHSYTLFPGELSHSFSPMCTPRAQAEAEDSVTVLRQPDVALLVNGSSVFGGDTVEVEAGHLVLLSLADSQGYIESATFWISGKLDSRGHDLRYAAVLFGEWDIGQTYPLTVTVSNTGMGVNSDSMTVSLLVVPEPGTLGLLGLAACCLLRKLRPAG